ncbi:MAG: prolyl oligopeptidase family serine peptidase [Bacteroidota bacterium]|nr:prolyl oligopeptidase family serine peptidase [Bacteroidota bacterium]
MRFTFIIFILCIPLIIFSQNNKKSALNHDVYDSWKNIKHVRVSDNGAWVSYEINPQKGDGQLFIYHINSGATDSVSRGYQAEFTPGSEQLVFRIKPQYDTIRQCKLKKVKKDKMPQDSLGIWHLATDTIIKYPGIKSFKLPEENSGWIAFLLKKQQGDDEDTTGMVDSTKVEKKPKSAEKTAELHIFNPVHGDEFVYNDVADYSISRNGESLAFIRQSNDSVDSTRVYRFHTQAPGEELLFSEKGVAKKPSFNNDGDMLAFIFSSDTGKVKIYELSLWKDDEVSSTIPKDHEFLPGSWSVSEHGNISFSEDGKRMYFGIAPLPEPEPEDTLTADEKVSLDIWNWQDALLQPHQLKRVKSEKNRNYLSVYHLKNNKAIMLEDTLLQNVNVHLKAVGKYALARTRIPYLKLTSWEAAAYHDAYIVDQQTGEKKKILNKVQSHSIFSPDENYILWYETGDSTWKIYDIEKEESRCLSCGLDVPFYDEEFDLAYLPNPYGIAGWSTDDEYVLIYDNFDIWKFDPEGREEPQKLTKGREDKIRFRYIKTDPEAQFVDLDERMLLSAFDEKTKAAGYYYLYPSTWNTEQLLFQDYSFPMLTKANDTGIFVFSKESFSKYPDLWVSGADFRDPVQFTSANPQQKKYKWGTAELVKWTSLDGLDLEGLLYKPEDFDAHKKYPMIVYFYETYSDQLHSHYEPKPSRSVINFSYYVSNDYLIFIPDIKYTVGYPGQSAYDAVMSGTLKLAENPWVDKEKMGLQGQSWGGYQVAYLVTQTDLFAAAEAGAPVSNMTSAYGGIRWGSGMSRMFQYEQSQSRIGGTLWEKPLHYLDNSPLFMAPDINTPLLIMHNDADGAVPWYQGIELFVALRRLSKPAWMLTYNGAPHNLKRRADMEDLTLRMQQFFDHFLKDKPAPRWMVEGIPAIEKGKEFGFELMEE